MDSLYFWSLNEFLTTLVQKFRVLVYLWRESLNFKIACLKLYQLCVLLFCVIIVGTCLYETANSKRSQEMRGDRDGECHATRGCCGLLSQLRIPWNLSIVQWHYKKGIKESNLVSFYLCFFMLVTNVYLSTISLKPYFCFFFPSTFSCLLSSDLSLMLLASVWSVHHMLWTIWFAF